MSLSATGESAASGSTCRDALKESLTTTLLPQIGGAVYQDPSGAGALTRGTDIPPATVASTDTMGKLGVAGLPEVKTLLPSAAEIRAQALGTEGATPDLGPEH